MVRTPSFFDLYGSTIRIDPPAQDGRMAKITITHPTRFDGETVLEQSTSFEFWLDGKVGLPFSDAIRSLLDPEINQMLDPTPPTEQPIPT